MASAAAKKGKKELKKLKIGKKKVLDFAGRHLVGEGIKEMNVADERAKEEVIVKAKTADVNLEGRIIASFSTGNGLEAQAMVQYYATPHAVSAQATPMPEIITQVQVIPFANSLAYAFVAPALQMHNLTADNALHMLPVKSETGFVAFSYNTSTIMYTAYEGAVSSTDNIEYTSIDYTPMLEYQVLTHGEPLGQYLASTMDKPMMMSQVYLKEDTSEQVSVRADIKIQYDAKQLTDLLEDVKTDSKIESIVQEYVVFVPQMMVRSYDNIETTINTETYQDVKVDHESVIPIMEKVDYVPQQQVDLQLVEMVMPDIKVDYKEDNLVREETIQQEDYTNLEQAIEEVNIEYQTAELPANNVIDLSEYREKTSTEYTAKEETKIEVKTDSENSDLSHVNTESTTNTMDISREMTTLDNKVDEETEETVGTTAS